MHHIHTYIHTYIISNMERMHACATYTQTHIRRYTHIALRHPPKRTHTHHNTHCPRHIHTCIPNTACNYTHAYITCVHCMYTCLHERNTRTHYVHTNNAYTHATTHHTTSHHIYHMHNAHDNHTRMHRTTTNHIEQPPHIPTHHTTPHYIVCTHIPTHTWITITYMRRRVHASHPPHASHTCCKYNPNRRI